MAPFYIIATLTPAPGKSQEVISHLSELAEHVKANEPGCLQYEMHQPSDADPKDAPIVMIEQYKDTAALDAHRQSEPYKALGKKATELQLLTAAPDVKVLQSVGGFGLR